VDVKDAEDFKKGYKITLRFDPRNPYFTEPMLYKV